MHPKDLSIKDYTYHLPEEKIAVHPLPERDASKLLIYKDGKITEDIYRNIATHIPPGSLLVFNDTKVVEARLIFQKPTGGQIEVFCLEPGDEYPDISCAMLQKSEVNWKCLIGGASKWKHGQVLEKKLTTNKDKITLKAAYAGKNQDNFIIHLSWTPHTFTFAEILHLFGAIPLPPYIKRAVEPEDAKRYQTVYAHYEGSVAAPTAGLHFTPAVLAELEKKNIQKEFVTLHVGAGTFKPVKSEKMNEHIMHAEYIHVSKETIEHILHHSGKPVIAVGTTSLRTLETLYWLGVKVVSRESCLPAEDSSKAGAVSHKLWVLDQWEAYELRQDVRVTDALHALIDWLNKNNQPHLSASTQLIIAPGYRLRIGKALLTNFHQPQSTLLLLVAAIAGNDWKKIYSYALEKNFRFLSYGDGSLIWSENDRG